MSRLTINAPDPGEARAPAAVNDAFAAIATVSTDLDSDNFAREGLDLRTLASNTPVQRVLGRAVASATTFTNTTAAILVLAAQSFSTALTVASGEKAVLRGAVHFETSYGVPTYGIPASRHVLVEFTKDNGATAEPGVLGRLGVYTTLAGGQGVVRLFHVLGPGTYTVGLMTRISAAGAYRVGRASFSVYRHKVQ